MTYVPVVLGREGCTLLSATAAAVGGRRSWTRPLSLALGRARWPLSLALGRARCPLSLALGRARWPLFLCGPGRRPGLLQ